MVLCIKQAAFANNLGKFVRNLCKLKSIGLELPYVPNNALRISRIGSSISLYFEYLQSWFAAAEVYHFGCMMYQELFIDLIMNPLRSAIFYSLFFSFFNRRTGGKNPFGSVEMFLERRTHNFRFIGEWILNQNNCQKHLYIIWQYKMKTFLIKSNSQTDEKMRMVGNLTFLLWFVTVSYAKLHNKNCQLVQIRRIICSTRRAYHSSTG